MRTSAPRSIPVFVLSLTGSPRRGRIANRLDQLGIPFAFLDGIDGRKLSPVELANVYDEAAALRRYGRALAPAEIGASLSHRLAYRRIVDDNIGSAIVFEDDAIIEDEFKAFWCNAPNLTKHAEIVSFYAGYGFVTRRAKFRVAGLSCHKVCSDMWHAVGYLIRRSAAETILRSSTRIETVPDWPISYRDASFFITLPFIVQHGDCPSLLEPGRDAMRKKWSQVLQSSRSEIKSSIPKHNGAVRTRALAYFDLVLGNYLSHRRSYNGYLDYLDQRIAEKVYRRFPSWWVDLSLMTTLEYPHRGLSNGSNDPNVTFGRRN